MNKTEKSSLSRGHGSLTADAGGTGLGRQQADVVPGAEFPQREEYPVDHYEAAHHAGLGEVEVVTGHDEADDGLQEDAEGECVPRAQPVGGRGPEHCAGDV